MKCDIPPLPLRLHLPPCMRTPRAERRQARTQRIVAYVDCGTEQNMDSVAREANAHRKPGSLCECEQIITELGTFFRTK